MQVESFVLTVWLIGVVSAVGIPTLIWFLTRKTWTKLPRLDIHVTGNGPPLLDQTRAIKLFQEMWPHGTYLSGLKIEWVKGEFFRVGRGAKAAGAMLNRDYIRCAEGAGIRALLHELVHVWGARTNGDPDAAHANQDLWELMYTIQLRYEAG